MIGDVLTSSILFDELRQKFSNARLDYLINEHTLPVVKQHPNIDNFILFTKEHEASKSALIVFARSLRSENYDIVIDVYSKISSNIITYFTKAKTRISYYKHYSTFIYNYNIKRNTEAKTIAGLAIENRLQLLEPLGIKADFGIPKIYLTDNEIEASKTVLKQYNISLSKPLFMISVLGSGSNKTYPFSYMAKIIDTISMETEGQILFNYIPNQLSDAKAIYDLCNAKTKSHIYIDVFGKNLREFLAITHHCTALIGNEGGAINMAKALNIKTFSIFSPWIDKKTWSTFEDGTQHVSVHLKDFKPELYEQTTVKKMKNKAAILYEKFFPALFHDKLVLFLSNFKAKA